MGICQATLEGLRWVDAVGGAEAEATRRGECPAAQLVADLTLDKEMLSEVI
jgi:hypothetical protein